MPKHARTRFRSLTLVLVSLLALLCLSLGQAGCGGGDTTDVSSNEGDTDFDGATRDWTILIYLGADNNLSTAGLEDIDEMEKAGSDSNINIIVQGEFSSWYTWDFSSWGFDYDDSTIRMRVMPDSEDGRLDMSKAHSEGNLDMTDPDTLEDFITWAVNKYPARKYVLILWNHGDGWRLPEDQRGVIMDDSSNYGELMTMPEVAQALANAGTHFAVVDFDACLMGMYEVAFELSGLASYLTFSEETEPGDGDPYDTMLSDLKDDPDMTVREFADTIVERYYESYLGGRRAGGITKSSLNMDRIDELNTAVQNLAQEMVDNYAAISSEIDTARSNAQNYYVSTYKDLYDFCSELAGQLAAGDSTRIAALAVMDEIDNAVSNNRHDGSGVSASHGVSIYLPTDSELTQEEYNNYAQLTCNSNRAISWIRVVDLVTGNTYSAATADGGFSYRISWSGSADMDLYIGEPGGLYSPYQSQSSPNGTFSLDSYDSGVNEEYYTANAKVQPGQYDVLIHFYDSGVSTPTNVLLEYRDPNAGVTNWTTVGTYSLNLTNPYGEPTGSETKSDFPDMANHSDWAYPRTFSVRSATGGKGDANVAKYYYIPVNLPEKR